MTPLPTINQSYAMLLQEENQRATHNSLNVGAENLAMNVKASYGSKPQNKGSKKSGDSSVICDYCHMSGHLKNKCYCIHGYPSWHKLYGKPKRKSKFLAGRTSVVANVTQTSPDVSSTLSTK